MLKAVFFDMDGVVADTEPLHFLAYQMLMKDFSVLVPEKELKEHIGLSEEDIWNKARSEHGVKLDFESFERKRRIYFFSALEQAGPAEGLIALLKGLNDKKIKIGLVTSSGKGVADKVLKRFNIEPYFEIEITGDDVKNKKPHKEPYMLAMSRLNVSREDCIGIEDSLHGIESLRSAGVKCIAIASTLKKNELSQADYVVGSLSELSVHKMRDMLKKKR